MKIHLFLLLFIFALQFSFAQEIAYEGMGKSELLDVAIYDILETNNQKLFLATDKGLFHYKRGEFILLENEKYPENSIFELIELSDNQILFHNLDGQWFLYNDSIISPFFNISTNELGNLFSTYVSRENIYIIGKNVFKYSLFDSSLIKITKKSNDDFIMYNSFQENDSLFLYNWEHNDEIIKLTDNSIDTINLKIPVSKSLWQKSRKWKLTKHNQQFYLVNDIGNFVSLATGVNYQIEKGIYHYKNAHSFYISHAKKGLYEFDVLTESFLKKSTLLEQQYISCVYRSESGLLLLGSFGEGLLVVRNQFLRKKTLKGTSDNIVDYSFLDNDLYILLNDGTIYQSTKSNIKKIDSSHYKVTKFWINPDLDFHLNQEYSFLLFHHSILSSSKYFGYGPIKDVSYDKLKNEMYIASLGLSKRSELEQDTSIWRQSNSGFGIYYHKMLDVDERITEVEIIAEPGELFFCKQKKLYLLNQTKSDYDLVVYKHKPIIVNSLQSLGDSLFIGSANSGVLVRINGEIEPLEKVNNHLIDNKANNLYIDNGLLIVNTEKNIICYSIKLDSVFYLSDYDANQLPQIKNFFFKDSLLYFLSDGNLYYLKGFNSSVQIDTLFSQELTVNLGDNLATLFESSNTSYSNNKLKVNYDFSHVGITNDLKIIYQLEGIDKQWETMNESHGDIIYKSLPPGKYKFSLFAKNSRVKSEIYIYNFVVESPWYQSYLFFISCLLVISIIVWLIIRYLNKKNLKKLQEQQLLASVYNSNLKAIRSQMNPHFIFNTLNSIQELVLKKETLKSYDYLVEFSEIVREILSNSEKDYIPLSKEIKFLTTYLSLESLRFQDSFEFEVNSSINKELMIPSLVVQPFVENAIQHGLIHKRGNKSLKIKFTFHEELKCVIYDTGIGREEAKKYKEDKAYDSFSLMATKERLIIFNKKNNTNARFEIQDWKENGQLIGTKVILFLPNKFAI